MGRRRREEVVSSRVSLLPLRWRESRRKTDFGVEMTGDAFLGCHHDVVGFEEVFREGELGVRSL